MRILVTGTTGYIGGRLVPRLLESGYEVRALARDPGKLRDVPWRGDVQIAQGDVTDPDAMAKACADVDVIYYLVHSLSSHGFATTDRQAALITAQAAREADVGRIVYLGGLRPKGDEDLSEHLASRSEVGEIFLRSGVPSAVLQAAVILGAGSASFEMLRYLTERLPVMVTPQWVGTRVQPIAVRDVLHYLVGAAELPALVSRRFDLGGPDVLTYRQMMQQYAKVAELPPRRVLPVPLLTPRLSSHWVNLVTPVPRSLSVPLIESLVHEMVCDEHDIARYVPDPPGGLTGYSVAVELALAKISAGEVETRWSDASVSDVPSDPLPSDPDWSGGSVYVDERRAQPAARPETLGRVVTGTGGVGLRRGRRNPSSLHVGAALGRWRVETLDAEGPERRLRLRAELKVPGLAWLELGVSAGPDGGSVYRQKAVFVPHGLSGQVSWWAVAPFRGIVFGGMTRHILAAAEGR